MGMGLIKNGDSEWNDGHAEKRYSTKFTVSIAMARLFWLMWGDATWEDAEGDSRDRREIEAPWGSDAAEPDHELMDVMMLE